MPCLPDRLRRLGVIAVLFGLSLLPAEAARHHVVQRGETLTSIAEKHGVTIAELARANKLRDRHLVQRGQRLEIPDRAGSFVTHRVVRGDTLARIAKSYQTTIANIRAYNELTDPDHIVPGQVLRIPVAALAAPRPAPPPAANPRRALPTSIQTQIGSVRIPAGRWKNIVIHHSATNEGSGRGMDRYHREERHMENGLAYHFVIGNGRGMGDGEIFIGRRWTEQLPGGHLSIEALNVISLGICLVGDFESRAPTRRQLESLEALVRALRAKTGVPLSGVTTHRGIQGRNHTRCPGRHFPTEAFLDRLRD